MSDKIKLALVGCGSMGYSHVARMKQIPEAEIVALCDIDKDHMDRMWKDKFNSDTSVRRYDSMEKLLKNPPRGLNGVILVTPHTLHFGQSMAALDAGYNVLVEKPMVTSSVHARKLAEKIKKTGLHFQIAFQAPFTAEFAYIRNAIQNQTLGELQTVVGWSHQLWRPTGPRKTWWWRANPKLSGGGQMYDTGAHLFNAISWALDRPVEEVFCWLDKKATPVDINAVMTIRWQGGVLGSVTISGNTPGWNSGIIIAGTKGRVHTEIHGGSLEHYGTDGAKIKYPDVRFAGTTPNRNFVDCLLGKAKPLSPVRYGILHSWLMDALYKSAKSGAPVKLTKPPLPDEDTSAHRSASSLAALVASENVVNPC